MALTFPDLAALLANDFDDVIDVRSPAEFAEDHIPGAINLPALSNEERAEIGTIYKQVAPFEARKKGAALVARNVATALESQLSDRSGSWRPLVYCWRGGQRSGSVATIFQQIGWRAETIGGGYQTFRRLVHRSLYEVPLPLRFVLLDGYTGTAKTDLLTRVAGLGGQVLDLEGMANHRGSLLGAMPGGQPAQKAFETRLAVALCQLDPGQPVLVEAESSKVGETIIPPMVWEAMKAAPRIEIEAPVKARATYLAEAYADLIEAPSEFAQRLAPLAQLRGAETVAGWQALLDARDFPALAAALMEDHYDPAYARSRKSRGAHQVLATLQTAGLAEPDRDRLAQQLIAQLSAA